MEIVQVLPALLLGIAIGILIQYELTVAAEIRAQKAWWADYKRRRDAQAVRAVRAAIRTQAAPAVHLQRRS